MKTEDEVQDLLQRAVLCLKEGNWEGALRVMEGLHPDQEIEDIEIALPLAHALLLWKEGKEQREAAKEVFDKLLKDLGS